MDADLIEALGGPDGVILSPPIDQHLHAVATDRELPEVSVLACLARFDEAAPGLRAAVARAAEGGDLDDAEDTLFFRGLHILAGARDTAAWPLLVRFLRRPWNEVELRLGDALTDTLSRIVIGLFDGDEASLFDLALDPDTNEFQRESLIAAAVFLTVEGRIERPRMEAFLRRFWDNPPDDLDFAWSGWLEAIAMLGLTDLAPLAHQAFDRGLVGVSGYDRKEFTEDLAKGAVSLDDTERLEDRSVGYIEDVIGTLRGFSFADEAAEDEAYENAFEALEPPLEPVRNPWRNVGRNDPCPCGSGKKAKKCCLATG